MALGGIFSLSLGSSSGGGTSPAFSTIQCDAGTSPVASGQDALTLTSTDNSLIITGNSATDTVTFTAGTALALLAGRSGGQTLIGGTAASNTLTLQSTSNATKGAVIIANQTGETTRIGPTGSVSSFNITHEFVTTNASSGATDGLAVHRNNANFNASSGTGSSEGWAILPRGPSGLPEIRVVTSGGDTPGYIRPYDSGFGALRGYFQIGSVWGFMNSSSALTTLKISGTTGQSVPLTIWSNQNDFGNSVSQVAADGHFQGPNGSASVPSHSFLNDTNTGMYGDGSDAIYWSCGGTRYASLSSAGLRVGVAGTTTGKALFDGATSGTVTVQSAAAAGTWSLTLPTSGGTSGYVLQTDGAGVSSWASQTVVKRVGNQTGTYASGTTQIPMDDTIPQNTEGDEYLSQAITPASSSNKLRIDVTLCVCHTNTGQITMALFQDSTADAIAASAVGQAATDEFRILTLTHTMTAGTTSATTFKVRAGMNSTGTLSVNGRTGSRKLGGVFASSITITEYV